MGKPWQPDNQPWQPTQLSHSQRQAAQQGLIWAEREKEKQNWPVLDFKIFNHLSQSFELRTGKLVEFCQIHLYNIRNQIQSRLVLGDILIHTNIYFSNDINFSYTATPVCSVWVICGRRTSFTSGLLLCCVQMYSELLFRSLFCFFGFEKPTSIKQQFSVNVVALTLQPQEATWAIMLGISRLT